MRLAQRVDPGPDQALHRIEEARAGQERDREEERKQKIYSAYSCLASRSASPRIFGIRADRRQRGEESGKRGQEQRHLVVDAVHDQHRNERHQRKRADLLRPLADRAPWTASTSSTACSADERRLVVARSLEHVMAIETVGELLADVVAQQPAARLDVAHLHGPAPVRATRRCAAGRRPRPPGRPIRPRDPRRARPASGPRRDASPEESARPRRWRRRRPSSRGSTRCRPSFPRSCQATTR